MHLVWCRSQFLQLRDAVGFFSLLSAHGGPLEIFKREVRRAGAAAAAHKIQPDSGPEAIWAGRNLGIINGQHRELFS